MNLLIIGNHDNTGNQRILHEARLRGHAAHIAHMSSIRIHTSSHDEHIILDDQPLIPKQYDVVYYRDMHPDYLSAYLALTRVFLRYGAIIGNPTLADKPFIWNKLDQMLTCADAGLRIPATTYLSHEACLADIRKQHSFPVVIKPIHGSHGTDVSRCDTMHELQSIARSRPWGTYIVQDYLEADVDYRVIVVNGSALGAVQKIPAAGEFRTNTDLGARFEACVMTDEMSFFARECARLFQLPLTGVDMRTHDGALYILEVNRNPGFTFFEEATGINVASPFLDYLESLV